MILCLKHVYIIKQMLWILLLEEIFNILCLGKPNGFQYYFVTINFFCFIMINATVVQIFFCERNCKRKITVNNTLTNKCNTIVDPAKKIFQLNQFWIWIYVKQGIISILFLQYFIWEFASWFYILSFMIQCHILKEFKPIICL